MKHFDANRQIWDELIKGLGGSRWVAASMGYDQRGVNYWRSGDRFPPERAIDWFIRACERHQDPRLRRIAVEVLPAWKAAAAQRAVVRRERLRALFFQRFGHWPDEPSWYRGHERRRMAKGVVSIGAVTPFLPGQSAIPRSRNRRNDF